MTEAQWVWLESAFVEGQSVPEDQRAAWLDRVCADRPELRAELTALLAASERSPGFLGDLAADLVGAELNRPAGPSPDDRTVAAGLTTEPSVRGGRDGEATTDPLVDTRIGAYRVIRVIGEGGMGEVYLAERDDEQYRQQVALKVVRPGFQRATVVQRFRTERQILARLVHPHIARLLDGGVTEAGAPYLVMEYIEGVPITEFCDRNRLSINDRLLLFRTVCGAVQFAHGNLVVHRDVKPSNVFVTDKGEVKLLDFGIAKLLDPDSVDMSIPVTATEVRVMTPEYAAPEQVRGEPITTATDVYALGVLLYELLTGHRPYRLPSHHPSEIERIICRQEPSWPSTVVGTRGDAATDGTTEAVTPERVSADRGTQTARLRKTLRGDLDNIVMMALRKEPERRYGSAGQLGEDVERYLAGRPIIARPDTLGYRMRKFVRRNRTGVAVAVGAFGLVLGFGVVMAAQAARIAEERDRAQLEAEKATQVAGFLEDLFAAPDPFAPTAERRDTLRVGDFLAGGAEKVGTELASQPAVQAQLFTVLGAVFQNLGDVASAQPLLEQALEIREGLYGGDHLEVAESQYATAMLLKDKGQYAEAETLLRQALATRRTLLGNEHVDVATSLHGLGSVLHDQGDLAGADSLYQESLAMRRELLGPDHLDVMASLLNLTSLYYQRGDFEAAEPLVRETLNTRRRILGPEHPEVAMTMGQLAVVRQRLGDLETAERLTREALQILRAVLGPDHPSVAHTSHNLGGVLKAAEKYDEAEPLFREAVSLWRAQHGNEHPNVATGLHNLAALLKDKGDLDAAEPLYRESLAIRRKLLGESHPSVAASYNNLGVLLKERGDNAAAVRFLRQAINVNVRSLGPEHPRVAITMETLGDLWYDAGRFDEAEPLFTEALAIYRTRWDNDHPNVIGAYRRLHRLYVAWDQPDRAAQYEALIP